MPELLHGKSSAGVLGAGIVLIVAGIVALVIFYPMVIKPAIDNKDFKETSCKVVEVRRLKNYVTCDCGEHCTARFPCVQVIVVYDGMPPLKGNSSDSPLNITRGYLMYMDENIMVNKAKYEAKWCTFFPDICDTTNENEKEIKELADEYGNVGETYDCFYDSGHPEDVIVEKKYDDLSIFYATFFPCLAIAVGLFLAIYMARYILTKHRRPRGQ